MIENLFNKIRSFWKKGFWQKAGIILLAILIWPLFLFILCYFLYHKFQNPFFRWGSIAAVLIITSPISIGWVGGIIGSSPSPQPKSQETTQTEIQISPSTEVIGEQTQATNPPQETIIPTSISIMQQVKVVRIIDGDTIEIEGGQRIRYIGIDTPESGGCFATQSTNKNKELVEGKTISLEKDVSETDRYGRLLRYVYVGEVMINEALVKEGYAQVYTYPPDVKYNERFLKAQKEARDNNKGLWSSCQSTPIPTTKSTSIQQTLSTPYPTTPPQSSSGGSCKYSCSSPDRDCSDFSTHAEAQTFFNCCSFTANNDPMRLDSVGVGDGIACESLP